jgi:hypothetical protein
MKSQNYPKSITLAHPKIYIAFVFINEKYIKVSYML